MNKLKVGDICILKATDKLHQRVVQITESHSFDQYSIKYIKALDVNREFYSGFLWGSSELIKIPHIALEDIEAYISMLNL
jgi:hypothetical protein